MTQEQLPNTEAEKQEDVTVDAVMPGFGAVLRQGREQCGYTIGDMVGRLRISVKQLRALESEEVDQLPEPVYVRGFIRAYARALQIDAAPLIQDYNTRFAPVDPKAAPVIADAGYSREEVFEDKRPSKWWRIIPLVLLLAAVVAGIWAVFNQKMFEERQEAAAQAATEQVQVAANDGKVEDKKPVEAAKVEPAVPSIPGVTVSADAGPVPAGEPGELRLRLSTKHSAWVRISRIGDDRTVFEQEMPAGAVRVVHTTKPVRIILGSTEGVAVEVNGVNCDYAKFISQTDKTARFRLH